MAEILKSHSDVLTVPEEIQRMKNDYLAQGYKCDVFCNTLKIHLDDGYVMIFWENGAFYQECHTIQQAEK